MTFSDEDLSELAECLEDACCEAERRGMRIVPDDWRDAYLNCCCPMGAIMNGNSYPSGEDLLFFRGIDPKVSEDFINAFGTAEYLAKYDYRVADLGRLFRERALAKLRKFDVESV